MDAVVIRRVTAANLLPLVEPPGVGLLLVTYVNQPIPVQKQHKKTPMPVLNRAWPGPRK